MALVVAAEGLPGCGKTTAIGRISQQLKAEGFRVRIVDIEASKHAPTLRAILREYPQGHPARIMLLWVMRIQQYDLIRSVQDEYDVVFSDRSWGSALAYDIYGNGVPRSLVAWVSRNIDLEPNITLFFDAPLEVVRQRKSAATMQDAQFAKRSADGYRALAAKFSWQRIDATASAENVAAECLRTVRRALRTK